MEDISFILKSLLKQRRLKKTIPYLTEIIHPQYKQVAESIKQIHHSSPPKNKRQFLSLLSETHSYHEIKEFGSLWVGKIWQVHANMLHSMELGHPYQNRLLGPKSGKWLRMNWKNSIHSLKLIFGRQSTVQSVIHQPVRYVNGNSNWILIDLIWFNVILSNFYWYIKIFWFSHRLMDDWLYGWLLLEKESQGMNGIFPIYPESFSAFWAEESVLVWMPQFHTVQHVCVHLSNFADSQRTQILWFRDKNGSLIIRTEIVSFWEGRSG